MEFNLLDIFSAFMVLFAVIDIIGSVPIIIDLKKKHGEIDAFKVSLVAFLTLIAFLFIGETILNIFGVDIKSFAIAGSFILFALSLEMILGIELFKNEPTESGKGSSIIVPNCGSRFYNLLIISKSRIFYSKYWNSSFS